MSEREPYAISGELILDGQAYPVSGPIGYTNLGRFAQRVILGDATRDDDDLISTWVLSDFSGGMGRFNLRAGVDEGRYWTGTLWAREPYAITLPRRTMMVAGLNDDSCVPLGVLADRAYFAFGRTIQRWDEITQTLSAAVATLGFDLVSPYITDIKGGAANAVLVLPEGINGYQVFDGTTISAVLTGIHPVAFSKWDDQLWALDVDGTLWATTDPPDEVTVTWTEKARLDGSEEPVQLFTYLDRADNWTLYVISRRSLWAYDPVNAKLIQTQFRDVYHPDMGNGVTIWRPGEDAFLSAGLQVWDWNLASASPMGPGNGDGVPWDLRGRILSLAAETNSMWALVEGAIQRPVEEVPEAATTDTPFDDTLYMAAVGSAVCSVMEWTGFGWHLAWRAETAAAVGPMASLAVLQAQRTVRAWWGYAGNLYTQLIPREMPTMRQLVESRQGDFASVGFLDTGWFDAGMRGFDKLASHVEVNLDIGDATDYFEVLYALDGESTFHSLDRADVQGRRVMPFNVDATGFARGLPWNRIRFILRGFAEHTYDSPLLDSVILKYLKLPLSTGAWRATIPLDFDVWRQRTAQQIKQDLDHLLSQNSFVKMQFGENDLPRRVRITSLDGVDDTGWSDLGSRQIAIAEIVLPASTDRI